MNWYLTFIFYLALFDAALAMAGGMVSAGVILTGVKADILWERIWPAVWIVIGSNVAAALILGGARYLGA